MHRLDTRVGLALQTVDPIDIKPGSIDISLRPPRLHRDPRMRAAKCGSLTIMSDLSKQKPVEDVKVIS